jgi:hypothetical protein
MAKRPLDIETGCLRIRLQYSGSLRGRGGGAGLSYAALSSLTQTFVHLLGRSALAIRWQPFIVGLAAAESPYDTACLKSKSSICHSAFNFLDYYTDDHCFGSRFISRVTSIKPGAAP